MRIRTALLCLAVALAARGARAAGRGAPSGAPAESPAAAPPAEPEAATATGEAETFESLASAAQAASDVGALLGALVDRCPDDKSKPGSESTVERSIDRARCRATLAFLRKALPEHPFAVVSSDAAAISVSPYDEALKGYRVGLSACVACTSPIRVGRSPDPVFVTLKKPGDPKPGDPKPGDTLAAAVEVASIPIGFPSQAEARRWLADVRPHLRADLIFNATANEWRFRSARGYALGLVAGRIVDGCSGTVVVSTPPSTGLAERTPLTPDTIGACKSPARAPAEIGAATAASDGDDDDEVQLPSELSRNVIAEAMGHIRAQVFACYERYGVRGTVPLTYEVAGNGLVQSVRIGGPLSGTPTGDCVVEAARGARFPRFDGPIQTFSYPFFLRR